MNPVEPGDQFKTNSPGERTGPWLCTVTDISPSNPWYVEIEFIEGPNDGARIWMLITPLENGPEA